MAALAPQVLPASLFSRLGPGNHVLDGVQVSPGKGQFCVGKGCPILKYRNTLRSVVCGKTAELIEMAFGLWTRISEGIMCYMGSRSPWEGAIFGERCAHCKV